MRYTIPVVLLFLLLSQVAVSQEFDCEVTINYEQLPAQARENLSDFVQQVKSYINNYKWTQEEFGSDRIKCSFEIFFQGSPSDNHYVAQAFVGSQRPINNLNQNTAILRLKDDKWEFDYVRFQPMTHDEYRFDPLLSLIDYYMFLILGYDFDTFDNVGEKATRYFQRASDVANKGRAAGAQGKGWEPSSQLTFSRVTLIDELLNPKMRDVREAIYRYHYRGLDYLASKPEKAKQSIFKALESIGNLQAKINQPSVIIRTFFDTKYLEIADLFVDYSDPSAFSKIARIDPSHQSTYEDYSRKRR